MHSAMMHHRPWPQYQQMMIEQYPYYQMITHDMHLQYSTNEHQEEEYEHSRDEMPSETSDDQNQNADMFRLAFAATQWSKLVLNAEGLFNKLMSTNALPSNEQNLLKNQIEQWLCMKQEYEECIAGDESVSLHGYVENTRRSLERIEEVTETTETDEKTDESNNWTCKQLQIRNKSYSSTSLSTSSKSETYDSTTDASDDSDQSDVDSENSDFIEKLEESMKKFEIDTDNVVDSMVNDFLKSKDNLSEHFCLNIKESTAENADDSRNNSPEPSSVAKNGFTTAAKTGSIRKQSVRRTSILPYSEMSDDLAEFQKQNSHSNNINLQQSNNHEMIPLVDLDFNTKTRTQAESKQNCAETSIDINRKSGSIKLDSSMPTDCEHLNTLKVLRTEIIEKQSQIKKIQFNLDSFRAQIMEWQTAIKEKEGLIEDMKQNYTTRKITEQKCQELKNKYQQKCLKYQKLLKCKQSQRNGGGHSCHQEIENYKELLRKNEKKLKNIEEIDKIVANSKKTLNYTKTSVNKLKNKMEVLLLQLKDEERNKEELVKEISDCQIKVQQLEVTYNLTPANLKKILSASEDGKNHRMKSKSDVNDCSTEFDAKSVSINDSMKEKSNCKSDDDIDEKTDIRQEIRDLRYIRDRLVKMQCEKSCAKMTPTTKIEKQVLQLSEFIECIDAMIEEKNVMICSRADLNQNRPSKIEQIPVFNRLEKLSHKELITLFYKYFYKVIDLKESSQNLEILNTVSEGKIESLKLQFDNEVVRLQRTYERQLTMLLNFYPDDSSSSVCESKIDKNREMEKFNRDLFKENQVLKQRLAHFESLLKNCKSGATQALQPHSIRHPRSMMKPQSIHPGLPQKPVVSREGNKIVLQIYDKKN